jgi:tripartite-type tricarboxylate transporter receptor subunit TctC
MAGELFKFMTGTDMAHVAYRGSAPVLTDLLGGQVQVLAADMPVLIAQIQAGALVPIGVAADKRDVLLPDVPTLAEQGYPNTDASNWYALLAPAKTQPAVIAKVNKAVNDALNEPDIRDKLVKSGAVPIGGTPESLGDFMKSEYEKWGKVVKERGIKDTQ